MGGDSKIGAVDGDKFLMRLIADQEHVLNTPQGRVWNEFADMIKGWLKSKEFALPEPASLDAPTGEEVVYWSEGMAGIRMEIRIADLMEPFQSILLAAGRTQPAPVKERKALAKVMALTLETGDADELAQLVMDISMIGKAALAAPVEEGKWKPTKADERKCPKCGSETEWVNPPIPNAIPFFQCTDGDCNWISDDGALHPTSTEGKDL